MYTKLFCVLGLLEEVSWSLFVDIDFSENKAWEISWILFKCFEYFAGEFKKFIGSQEFYQHIRPMLFLLVVLLHCVIMK